MAWNQIVGGLVLVVISAAFIAGVFRRARRLLEKGERVQAAVVAAEPDVVGPYGLASKHLKLRFEIDGKAYTRPLVLEHSSHDDYVAGQPLEVLVARRWRYCVRTELEPNTHVPNLVGGLGFVFGIVLIVLGIV